MKDLFISHASEDKNSLVRPLAERLTQAGVDVWYDEYSILPGDSISASIDKGLIGCKYGLIIISPAFLEKKWTDYKLKSLLVKEVNQCKCQLESEPPATLNLSHLLFLFLCLFKSKRWSVHIKNIRLESQPIDHGSYHSGIWRQYSVISPVSLLCDAGFLPPDNVCGFHHNLSL